MNRAGMTFSIAALMATAGCASYRGSGSPHAALPLPPDLQEYYCYSPTESKAEVHVTERNPSYTVKEITLPVTGSHDSIRIVWYAPNEDVRQPLIVVSPIRGSDTIVVDGCARVFASSGYHAAIVKRARFDFDPAGPLTQVEDSLRTAVIRHRQALDWLLAQPGIDKDRVAAFGISYGAIITASLAAVEPRLKASVIDLAGGPLAGVMRSSEEHSLRRSWKRSRQDHGLTNEELYEALRSIIRTDPVKLAPYVARDNVLMLIARFDSSVPTRYQVKLWRALGEPRADFIPVGHYTSILVLPAHRLSIMRFFEEKLAEPPPAPAPSAIQAKN
jgi:dienelactone hydrolase